MSKYAEVAVKAARMATEQKIEPRVAWQDAADTLFGQGTSQASKGCPKGAFLGLCEEGLVKGVPSGHYTRSRLNKDYAVKAVKLLRQTPQLARTEAGLWDAVMAGKLKSHNHQMTIVVALWKAGLIV